jgi:hypothetical protein
MRPTIIRTILSPDIPGNAATIGVALGLINTLSTEIAKDLTEAQHALGQRRRPEHDRVLAETVTQAESLAYVARWVGARLRAAKINDEMPVVITGLPDDNGSSAMEFDS